MTAAQAGARFAAHVCRCLLCQGRWPGGRSRLWECDGGLARSRAQGSGAAGDAASAGLGGGGEGHRSRMRGNLVFNGALRGTLCL